jgi:drug/metabolite transporter (DMT)-like permease
MFGLAVLCTSFAYIVYFLILERAGATNISLVTFLVPISAIILGVLVLGEIHFYQGNHRDDPDRFGVGHY